MSSLEALVGHFRQRRKPQHRAILAALTDLGEHPTSEENWREVRGHMPDISPAMIYNTLRLCADGGELDEFDLGRGRWHFEISPAKHARGVSLECGRNGDVWGGFDAVRGALLQSERFHSVRPEVTAHGYFANCGSSRGGYGTVSTAQMALGGLPKEEDMTRWECTVCGYVYDPAVDDPDGGIAPGTAFDDLPDDWVCPECGVGKDEFERVA